MTSEERKTKRASRRDWPALVQAQATSGQSVREFCQSHGLSTTYFYARRREFTPTTSSVPRRDVNEFVALPIQAPSVVGEVEVSLGDEVIVRVRRG